MACNDWITVSGVILMYTNADMTLYSWSTSGYTRKVIKGVFWQEVKQSNIEKIGLVSSDSVKVFIPVKSAQDSLCFTTSKDLAVKGVIAFEFDNTSEATRSTSFKSLNTSHDVHTVNAADGKLYGSSNMQHYQISCK